MPDVVAAAPLARRFGRYDVAVEIASPRFSGGSTVYIAIARPTKNNDAASSSRLALSYSPARPNEPTKTIQRPVALKAVDRSLTSDEERVARFIEAARAATEVHHPNLLEVDEVGRDGDDVYVVMDYRVGETVASVMRRLHSQGERLQPVLAAHIIAEAAAGLEAGHAAGILHGHLTPHDIFIGHHGSVQVIDVGLAQARYELAGEQIDGVELEYASPERCNRETLDRRSDVFSLGTILWELLTGLSPFERPADVDVMRAIRDESVTPPKRIVPGLPKEISVVTLQALRRDRTDRYQTAQALRVALADPVTKASKGESPDAALAALMKRLFPERGEQKRELVKRVEAGKPTMGLDFQAIDRSTRAARPLPILPAAPPASTAPPSSTSVKVVDNHAIASVHPPARSYPPAEALDQPSVVIAPSVEPPLPVGALVPSTPPPNPAPFAIPDIEEPLEPPPPQTGNRGLIFAGAGLFALVAIIGGVVISARTTPKDTKAAPIDAGIVAVASSSPPPIPEPVADVPAPIASGEADSDTVVHIDTVPAQATVWIDGAKRGVSPLDLHLVKGTTPVVVEIRHQGFATLKENVVPDVNQRLKLTLITTGGRRPAPAASTAANPYHKFE